MSTSPYASKKTKEFKVLIDQMSQALLGLTQKQEVEQCLKALECLDFNPLTYRPHGGKTPYFIAAIEHVNHSEEMNSHPLVEKLIDKGCSVESISDAEISPLEAGLKSFNLPALNTLTQKGARWDVSFRRLESSYSFKHFKGDTLTEVLLGVGDESFIKQSQRFVSVNKNFKKDMAASFLNLAKTACDQLKTQDQKNAALAAIVEGTTLSSEESQRAIIHHLTVLGASWNAKVGLYPYDKSSKKDSTCAELACFKAGRLGAPGAGALKSTSQGTHIDFKRGLQHFLAGVAERLSGGEMKIQPADNRKSWGSEYFFKEMADTLKESDLTQTIPALSPTHIQHKFIGSDPLSALKVAGLFCEPQKVCQTAFEEFKILIRQWQSWQVDGAMSPQDQEKLIQDLAVGAAAVTIKELKEQRAGQKEANNILKGIFYTSHKTMTQKEDENVTKINLSPIVKRCTEVASILNLPLAEPAFKKSILQHWIKACEAIEKDQPPSNITKNAQIQNKWVQVLLEIGHQGVELRQSLDVAQWGELKKDILSLYDLTKKTALWSLSTEVKAQMESFELHLSTIDLVQDTQMSKGPKRI